LAVVDPIVVNIVSNTTVSVENSNWESGFSMNPGFSQEKIIPSRDMERMKNWTDRFMIVLSKITINERS